MEGQAEVELKPPLPKWQTDATEEDVLAALEEEGNFDRTHPSPNPKPKLKTLNTAATTQQERS